MSFPVFKSLIMAPCPKCGGTPLFTATPKESHMAGDISPARMICVCGFEGHYGSVLSIEGCYAAWNAAVAWENRRRLEES